MRAIQTLSHLAMGALLVVLAGCHASSSRDAAAITALMMSMFDKPEAPLVVGPIAARGDAAVADWTQGALGGRALLKRRGDEWSIVLCAGDGIKGEAALIAAGLSSNQAQEIAAELTEREKSVSAARLAAMSAFRGVVRMGPSSAHPSANTSHAGIVVNEAIVLYGDRKSVV